MSDGIIDILSSRQAVEAKQIAQQGQHPLACFSEYHRTHFTLDAERAKFIVDKVR